MHFISGVLDEAVYAAIGFGVLFAIPAIVYALRKRH
jgi:hypothetical protein